MDELRKHLWICPLDHNGAAAAVHASEAPGRGASPPVLLVNDLQHGFVAHEELTSLLAWQGYRVFMYDHRGQLRGQAGKVTSDFAELVSDALQVAAWARHKSGQVSPVWMGVGIGALVSLFGATEAPRFCRGLILISPALSVATRIGSYKRFFLQTLSDLAPTMRIPRWLFRRFGDNHALPPAVSARSLAALLRHMPRSRKRFQRLDVPVLMITDPNGGRLEELFRRLASKHRSPELFTFATRPDSDAALVELVTTWLAALPEVAAV